MAIELITGLPGHGKTLYTISRYKAIAEKDGRPIFYSGIKGIKLPWVEHDPKAWEDLPPNAILIIDEAQFVFPLRGRGSPEEWIQRLAVHRHAGLDLVLITQDPLLIDSFVRRLCDRHWHVVRKFGTSFATLHEYPNGVRDRVAQSRGDSIKHEWRYPKEAFEWYHSAEVHTVKRRIPMRVWLLVAAPIVAIALGWIGLQRILPKDKDQVTAESAAKNSTARPGAVTAAQPQRGRGAVPLEVMPYLELHRPRVAGLAYTAPIYDEVTKPAEAPYPAACVSNDKRCQCYSQQATRLEVPQDLCQAIAAGGFFVAWRAREGQAVQPSRGVVPGQAPPLQQAGQAPMLAFNAGERREVMGAEGQAAAPSGVTSPGGQALRR